MPREEIEFSLTYNNTASVWISIDQILDAFGLDRDGLGNGDRVADAVRAVAERMPTYVTLKEAKKRSGRGQEDVYPVVQFVKRGGDMTSLPELECRFMAVPRVRGQEIREPAQLDGWLREGSARAVESICEWE